MKRPKRVQHHLAVMVAIHKDALPRLEVADVQQPFSVGVIADYDHVSRPEPGGGDVAVVHALFHQHQRLAPVSFHLFDNGDDEFRVHISDLVDLLRIELLALRPFYPFMQVFPHLVLADLVGERALGGKHRAFIWKSLLQSH